MALSEDDIQQLEMLTELYNSGRLSEDQFDRQTSTILRSVRKRRRRRTNSLIGRIFSKSSKPKKKRKRKRTSPPRKKIVVERRYLEDALLEAKHPTGVEKTPEPQVFPDRYSQRRRQPSSTTLMSMRHSANRRRSSIASTAVTIAIAIGITLLISSSDPMERLITNLESSNATAIALPSRSTDTHSYFIEPLFGPLAVKQCRSHCDRRRGSAQETCLRSCERFSMSEYGRRITAEQASATADANSIVKRCRSKEIPSTYFASQESWLTETKAAGKLLQKAANSRKISDFGRTRLLYNNLFDVNTNLRLPPKGSDAGGSSENSQLSQKLIRATCMRAHLALTELGILMAKESADDFSRRYFRDLHQTLRGKIEAYESDVLTLLKNKKFIANG